MKFALVMAEPVATTAAAAAPAVNSGVAGQLTQLVLGLLLAGRQVLPEAVVPLLIGGFALFHGAAHGAELAGQSAGWVLAGMTLATGLLHAVGIALGMALRQRDVWLPRLAGAGVALFGSALLIR